MTKSPKGDDIVILSRDEYDRLIEAAEDRADAEAARHAIERAGSGKEILLTETELDEYLAAKTPLAFWRRKRGLTQAVLAKTTGLSEGFLSEIESGQEPGTPAALEKIAQALDVTIGDLCRLNPRERFIHTNHWCFRSRLASPSPPKLLRKRHSRQRIDIQIASSQTAMMVPSVAKPLIVQPAA
jgi:transcriptional regulator with XRE-family HTH domain